MQGRWAKADVRVRKAFLLLRRRLPKLLLRLRLLLLLWLLLLLPRRQLCQHCVLSVRQRLLRRWRC